MTMRTCMKNLLGHKISRLAFLSLLAALAGLTLPGSSEGQITTKNKAPVGKTTKKDIKDLDTTGILADKNTFGNLPEASLSITQFSVVRDGGSFLNKIRATGAIKNSGVKTS